VIAQKSLKACLVPVFIRLYYALIEELLGACAAYGSYRNLGAARTFVDIRFLQSFDNTTKIVVKNAY
jgi:hypothetical protein